MVNSFRISSVCGFLFGRTIQNISSATKLNLHQKNRQFCTKSEVAITIPCAVRPSSRLIAKSENKNKFLRLLLELELLYGAAEAKLPTYFSDSDWIKYVQMTGIIERCCYLHQLYESRKEIEGKHEIKMRREVETAYNRRLPISALYYFEREDFRKSIVVQSFNKVTYFEGFAYEIFGCRLLAAWRCKDSFPPLLVDCCYIADLNHSTQRTLVKQMKDLLLDNSLKRNPFPIVFVNYRTTINIVEEVVNSWLRKRCLPKYRPSTANESEGKFKELSDEKNDKGTEDYACAPFIPVVTSATVRECLGCTNPEEIAYINPRAAEYLPLPLSKYKAFVLCATPDNKLMNSAFQAAKTEQLNSYKLPITKFLNMGQTAITMPLRITVNVIRDVYASDCEWRRAFEKHIPYFNILANNMYRDYSSIFFINISAIGQWLSDAEQRGKRKRKFFHSYSRKERREIRAMLTERGLSR
uniref:SAM-dependent MTase TRM10-type domain-containing protein n=1 Tax=Elaeophora elaphi TaxID=1147741 RepID=A0A0R3RRI6_9BILA